MKKRTIIGIISISLLVLLSACGPQPLQTIGSSKYYVYIHKDGESYTEDDDTRYRYDVEGYDKDGHKNSLTFTAGHQLEQGAYLTIYYKDDKVITYEETDSDDVPQKAKHHLEDS